MAWDVISKRVGSLWRASLPRDELPPASAAVDARGTEETCSPMLRIYVGYREQEALQILIISDANRGKVVL